METFTLKAWVLIFALLLCCSIVFGQQSPGISDPAGTTLKQDDARSPASAVVGDVKIAPAEAAEETAPDAAAIQHEDEPEINDPEEPKGTAPEKRAGDSTGPVAEKPGPVQWENDEQKSRCESHLARLKENFLRARYHSIQGDSCVTAEHARLFLELVEVCEKECPENLLDRSGYSKKVVRNLNWLYKLGKERCLK